MTPNAWFTTIGAAVLACAAAFQAQIDLANAWAWQRQAARLDPQNTKAARRRQSWPTAEGYESPGLLPWIPSSVHAQIGAKSLNSGGWMLVSYGSTLTFAGSLPAPTWALFLAALGIFLFAVLLATWLTRQLSREGEMDCNLAFVRTYGFGRFNARLEEAESSKFFRRAGNYFGRMLRNSALVVLAPWRLRRSIQD
ncbi:hypothetical protein M3G03_05775 [Aestuariimicrobium sp. p3-SID1156]|uniref:hypothetical protein n=1 Tax=Aestuariimicrobium sp. p3-SID1156 TaxID=2916038 RepID=UPI00223AF314|nr:hypothetical protein [Aestuariimicrobium sp. p3-SID1156]MCT1459049.1 hypothetical protein [Aestuariimicrobium sp. p3-SID1156]